MFVLLLAPFLMGPSPSGGCASRPSTFFTSLDKNLDTEVSYAEWMAYYLPHEHSISQCSRRDFYLADCNLNGILTWDEYYQQRFKRQDCNSFGQITSRESLKRYFEAIEEREISMMKRFSIQRVSMPPGGKVGGLVDPVL